MKVSHPPLRQRGAAVILALLTVALVAGIAAAAVGDLGVAMDQVQGRHDQARYGTTLIAEALDQAARGKRNEEVGAEKAGLHEHRLQVAQRVQRLQVRDKNVVQRRQQPPHEEEQRDD